MKRSGLTADPDEARLDVASRTDRGVSARGNALALTSDLPGPALLRALNGVAAEIFFTAASGVDAGFRPRAAKSRTYVYFEADPVGPLTAYRHAAAAAVGTIDVRSFGRGLPSDVPVPRTITRFEVTRDGTGLRLELEAPSFVWGMVRKLVASVRDVVRRDLPIERFRAALRGEVRLTVPLAPPEPLVLWEVDYGRPWDLWASRLADRQVEYLGREGRAALTRARLLAVLDRDGAKGPEVGSRRLRTGR